MNLLYYLEHVVEEMDLDMIAQHRQLCLFRVAVLIFVAETQDSHLFLSLPAVGQVLDTTR